MSVDDERVWVEGESNVRDLDLWVKVALVCKLLLERHDQLAKVKFGLQIYFLLDTRGRVSDFAGSDELKSIHFHDNLPLIEEQVCLHGLPRFIAHTFFAL